MSNAQQSLLTNYNTSTTGFTVSVSEPLKHLWSTRGVSRVGITYALSRASVTTFNDNTRNVFQSLAFRSGVAGPNQLNGIITSTISPSFTYSEPRPRGGPALRPRLQRVGADRRRGRQREVHLAGRELPAVLPDEGPAHQPRRPQRPRHARCSSRTSTASAARSPRPPTASTAAARTTSAASTSGRHRHTPSFRSRSSSTSPTPTAPLIPRDPTNPSLGNIQIPIPIYRLVSVGGDTQLTANIEYRIPIVNQVTFAFFTDFGLTGDLEPSQLRQSVAGAAVLSSPLYGCPQFINGACYGGKADSGLLAAAACTPCRTPTSCRACPSGARVAGDPAHRQCAVPASTTRITRCGSSRTCRSNWPWTTTLPHPVPEQRRGALQLPAGTAALRPLVPVARAAQDLPPDREHDLLSPRHRVVHQQDVNGMSVSAVTFVAGSDNSRDRVVASPRPCPHIRESSERGLMRLISATALCLSSLLSSTAYAADAPPAVLAVSDAHTTFSVKGSPAKPSVPAWPHWLWPKIEGATWVWTAYKVTPAEAHDGSPIVTFRRTFNAASAGQGTLQITADNGFDVSLKASSSADTGLSTPLPTTMGSLLRSRPSRSPFSEAPTPLSSAPSTITAATPTTPRPTPLASYSSSLPLRVSPQRSRPAARQRSTASTSIPTRPPSAPTPSPCSTRSPPC